MVSSVSFFSQESLIQLILASVPQSLYTPRLFVLSLFNPPFIFLNEKLVGLHLCGSCGEFTTGTNFLINLNKAGDTVPGIEYLMIASSVDEIVIPYTSGFLRDHNPLVHNQILQDWCSSDTSGHFAMVQDPVVFRGVHAFFTPLANQINHC